MATSIIEICNNALAELKADTITALTEDSANARLCNQRWPAVRKAVLASHPWNCAMKQAELAASATAPTWKWDYAYPLPTDCLRIFEVVDSGEAEISPYEVQGRSILCNEPGPIYIGYVHLLTDPTQYDALLDEALAYALAARIAYPVTASTTQQQAMWTLFENVLKQARGVDAKQGTADTITESTWLYAKLGKRYLG